MNNVFAKHMDYHGQEHALRIAKNIVHVSAVIGFVVGYVLEDFFYTFVVLVLGTAVSCITSIPPWKMFNRHPLTFYTPSVTSKADEGPASVRTRKPHGKRK